MIESAAYDIIKQEGYEEGIKAGIQHGMEKGVQQGMLFAIKSMLEWKFGTEGLKIYLEIKKIKDIDLLEAVTEAVKVTQDISEIKSIYQ